MSKRESEIYRVTLVGSAGNLLLVAFKFITGFLGHSAAMIADAVHSVSDLVTDIIVLAFVKISGKPLDKDHNFGHGKFETLATAIIGLVLLAVAIGIMWDGAERIWLYYHGHDIEQPGMIALIAALVSIAVKEALYRYTVAVGRRIDSQVVIANAWHHRSDAFSSIATAVGIGGAIVLGHKWIILDPLAACIVSILVFKSAVDLVVPSVNELLEKSLPEEIQQEILRIVKSFPEVSDPHNIRTRRVGPMSVIDIHVRMDPNMTVGKSHEITRQIEAAIRKQLGQVIINIHVEPIK